MIIFQRAVGVNAGKYGRAGVQCCFFQRRLKSFERLAHEVGADP